MRITPVAGLGYVVVAAPAPSAWADFAAPVLGAMSAEGSETDPVRVRLDDRMARIIVAPGDAGLHTIGWEVAGRQEWAALRQRFDAVGLAYEILPSDVAQASRSAAQVLRTRDPSGNCLEFALAPLVDPVDHFVSPVGARFVTGDQGLGHVTMAVARYEETALFYTDLLGFHVRDGKDVPGGTRAIFAGCNPRQHSIALIDGKGTNFVHHLMLEVDSLDTVGRALDQVLLGTAGTALTISLGRHWNDGMTSFYLTAPGGLQIEYGFGGERFDPDTRSEVQQGGVGKGSYWGHHPVASQ